MRRFRAALREVAGELDLPQPVRSEILMELASDLEAAFEDHRAQGLGEAEAARRAEEMILGSREVARRLGRLHAGRGDGWRQGAGARLTEGTGIVLVALAVVPMLAMAGGAAAPLLLHPPGRPSSWLLAWLVFAAGVGLTLLVALEGIRIARGRLPTRTGPTLVILLSVLAPALGLLAVALGLYSAGTTVAARTLDAAELTRLMEVLARDGALLAIGLLTGIVGALLWFVIVNRTAILAEREADALLDDDGSPPPDAGESGVIPLVRRRSS